MWIWCWSINFIMYFKKNYIEGDIMDIINKVIFPSLDIIKKDENLIFENSKDLILFGDGAVFDSLTIVMFLMEVQDMINSEFNQNIEFSTDANMFGLNSPFKSVKTLSDYIYELLK